MLLTLFLFNALDFMLLKSVFILLLTAPFRINYPPEGGKRRLGGKGLLYNHQGGRCFILALSVRADGFDI